MMFFQRNALLQRRRKIDPTRTYHYDYYKPIHDRVICCELKRYFRFYSNSFISKIKRRDNSEQIALKLHSTNKSVQAKLYYLYFKNIVRIYDSVTGREIKLFRSDIIMITDSISKHEDLFLVDILAVLKKYPLSASLRLPIHYSMELRYFLIELFMHGSKYLKKLYLFLRTLGVKEDEYELLYKTFLNSFKKCITVLDSEQFLVFSDMLTCIQYGLYYIGGSI